MDIKDYVITKSTSTTQKQLDQVAEIVTKFGYTILKDSRFLQEGRSEYQSFRYSSMINEWAGLNDSIGYRLLTVEAFIKKFGKSKYSIKALYEK